MRTGCVAINKSAKHLPSHAVCRKADFLATGGGGWGGAVVGFAEEGADLLGRCTEVSAAGSGSPLALLVAYKEDWLVAAAGVMGTALWRAKSSGPSPASSAPPPPSFSRPGTCCRGGSRQGLGLDGSGAQVVACRAALWLPQASGLSPFSASALAAWTHPPDKSAALFIFWLPGPHCSAQAACTVTLV